MFVRMRWLVLMVAALLACRDNPPFYANAYFKVVDDRVEIEIYGDPDMTFSIPGLPTEKVGNLPGTAPWKMSVPLDKFKDGENRFEVVFEQRGKQIKQSVSFTKPPGAAKPFVRLAECDSSGTSSGHAKLDAGDLGKVDYCWAWSDGNIRVGWAGSVGGKITVGDATGEIGKDGKAVTAVSVRPLILRAPIRAALGDGAGISTQLPVTFVKGAEKVEGKLSIDLRSAAKDITKALFKDVGGGAPLSGDGASRSKSSLVYLSADKYRAATHYGRLTSVGEVGLVAIGRDIGEPRDGGKCGPYKTTGTPEGAGDMAPRSLVDVQVQVFDATTGQKLGAKDFKADESIACPLFVSSNNKKFETITSRPEEKTIAPWLERVADEGKP